MERSATLHKNNLALIPRDWSKGARGAQQMTKNYY